MMEHVPAIKHAEKLKRLRINSRMAIVVSVNGKQLVMMRGDVSGEIQNPLIYGRAYRSASWLQKSNYLDLQVRPSRRDLQHPRARESLVSDAWIGLQGLGRR